MYLNVYFLFIRFKLYLPVVYNRTSWEAISAGVIIAAKQMPNMLAVIFLAASDSSCAMFSLVNIEMGAANFALSVFELWKVHLDIGPGNSSSRAMTSLVSRTVWQKLSYWQQRKHSQ